MRLWSARAGGSDFTPAAGQRAASADGYPSRLASSPPLMLLLVLLLCSVGGGQAAAHQHAAAARSLHQQQQQRQQREEAGVESAATSPSDWTAASSTAVPSTARTLSNAYVQGMRECNAKEKRKAACLAGECASLQTSNVHTYVICRCPMGRTGKRCEERTVSHDVITWMAKRLADLPLQVRCEHQNVNILAKQGFESSFAECVKYQASKKGKVKDPAARHPPPPAGSSRRRTAAAVSAIRAIFGFPKSATGAASGSISSSTLAALLLPPQWRPAAVATASRTL